MKRKPVVFLDLLQVNLAEEREHWPMGLGLGFKCASVISLLLYHAQVLLSCLGFPVAELGIGRRWREGGETAEAFWLSSKPPRSLSCRPGPNLSPCAPGGNGVTHLGLR